MEDKMFMNELIGNINSGIDIAIIINVIVLILSLYILVADKALRLSLLSITRHSTCPYETPRSRW
jgi:hypothetical protein